MTAIDPRANGKDPEVERVAALRHDLGTRCEFLANRAENGGEAMCAGAALILKVVAWCLKRNDAYGGGLLKQVETCAQLGHAVMTRLEAVHQAALEGPRIAAPSVGAVLAVDRSKQA